MPTTVETARAKRRRLLALSGVAATALILTRPAPAQAPGVFLTLFEPEDSLGGVVSAVSPNGAFAAGEVRYTTGDRGASWSSAGVLEMMPNTAAEVRSSAAAVSNNGALAGTAVFQLGLPANDDVTNQAFVWRRGDLTITGLGFLSTSNRLSAANDISASGGVVVGNSNVTPPPNQANGAFEAFRWTAGGGMVSLGDLPGGELRSRANAVSADGSVIVGNGASASGTEAFRWTPGGMVGLGDLTGATFSSSASEVSANGSVVVGSGRSDLGNEAFRWTAATGMVGLGDLPGGSFSSSASSVSADGSVVVGTSPSAAGNEAFFWTAGRGMVSLKRYLQDTYPASLPAGFAGWRLTSADVSDDGRVIAGRALVDADGNTVPFMVRLPASVIAKWTPIDISVNRTDNTSRLLWQETATNRYAVWKISSAGVTQTGKYYGPLAGYVCEQIVVAPNGQTTLFWRNAAASKFALWTIAADLSSVVKTTTFNYPAGYIPQNLAADAGSALRLSLRGSTGKIALWTITPATGAISGSATYGPYANLQDGPLAVGPDGRIRLLWRNTVTGAATLWTIPATYGAPLSGYVYAWPGEGARASDIAVGMDNKTRVQWTYSSGRIALWKINTVVGSTNAGVIETGKFYGPLAGVMPLGLSMGGDNQTRQLFQYGDGKTVLWSVADGFTGITNAYTYGPIK